MKKRMRRLRLERETLRDLTPEQLHHVAGGTGNTIDDNDTRHNSCNFAETNPWSICQSCLPLICG